MLFLTNSFNPFIYIKKVELPEPFTDSRLFSLGRSPNDAYFFVCLKAYKKPAFANKNKKKRRNPFPTGAKI